MKKKIKKLNKHIFVAEEKIQIIAGMTSGPMAKKARGGENNKMNVMGPAESLIRNYDHALRLLIKIPDELFVKKDVPVTEVKRLIQSVQAYKLKTELEKIFLEDPVQREQKFMAITKHLEIINEMISLMGNQEIFKPTA